MRAPIVCLLVLAAFPTRAQTAAPSKEALTLGGRVAHAAHPQLERGLQAIVDNHASNSRHDAGQTGLSVDEKILAEAGKDEFAAARPLLWDGMARVYAETYSLDELKALEGLLPRAIPARLGPDLPASLAAKDPATSSSASRPSSPNSGLASCRTSSATTAAARPAATTSAARSPSPVRAANAN